MAKIFEVTVVEVVTVVGQAVVSSIVGFLILRALADVISGDIVEGTVAVLAKAEFVCSARHAKGWQHGERGDLLVVTC